MGDSLSNIDISKYMNNINVDDNYNMSSEDYIFSQSSQSIETVSLTNSSDDYFSMNNSNDISNTSNNNSINSDFLEKYFTEYGDVNNDGKIDSKDVADIQNVLVGKGSGSYDIDGDGETTSKDVTILQKYINGDEISESMLNVLTNPNIDAILNEKYTNSYSNDDIKKVLNNMTQEEYNQYVSELKEQYDTQIESLKNYKSELEVLYKEPMNELYKALHPYNKIIGIQGGTPVYSSDVNLNEPIEGMSRDEVQKLYDTMQAELDAADAKITQVEKEKNNCDYYGLIYTKTYLDYKPPSIDIAMKNTDKFIWKKSMPDSTYRYTWNYSVYKQQCGNEKAISPLQYVESFYNYSHSSLDLHNLEVDKRDALESIVALKDDVPDYYKTYCYLYDQDPELANKYLSSMEDEILNVRGQYLAENDLKTYFESDGENDIMEGILNNLHVTGDGLSSGLCKFYEGGIYSFEALLTAFGYDGTTQMSSSEYASMYKLYGLMSQNNKEKMGLIKKNPETGKYENVDSNSIIDFTRNISGFELDKDYQISEGLGNALPSVAISFVNPMAGSVSMGIVSGGNAYHGSMLQGYSNQESIMYGIFTGTANAIFEKTLGGLPGLSKVQTTSLRTYLSAAGREVASDQIVGLMDDLYRANFMGESFPETEEEWAAYFEKKMDMAIQSAVTSGIMNAPALGTSIYKKRTFNADIKKLGLTNADIDDALSSYRRSNDALANLSNDELIVNYGDQILKNIKDRLNVDSNGTYDASLRRFRKDSNDEYGGDQASLINKYKKNRKGDRAELEEIILAVKKDHPEFTDKDLELFFTNLNKGGCTYISTTNIIFEQFGYDADAFRSSFGFDMYDSKGNLNHDRLVADIYSYLSDKVEFNYTGQSKSYEFTSNAAAAQTLLGKTFSNDTDAFLALHDSGYIADGRSSSGNPIFTKFEQSQQTFFGTPSDIAYQITGEKVQLNSSLELKNYLDAKGIGGSFSLDSNNSTKLFGHGDGFEKWMGRYFNDRGIDLNINTFDMPTDGDYNSLVDNINLAIQNGYSINIAATSMQEISMTNGKLFGWTTIGGSSGDGQTGGVGHAMTFRGFDSNGDIQVSSWGEIYTIPKEYFDRLKIKAISVNGG